jgi:precorrin-6B methylase 1
MAGLGASSVVGTKRRLFLIAEMLAGSVGDLEEAMKGALKERTGEPDWEPSFMTLRELQALSAADSVITGRRDLRVPSKVVSHCSINLFHHDFNWNWLRLVIEYIFSRWSNIPD